jgi:hypothetical protein
MERIGSFRISLSLITDPITGEIMTDPVLLEDGNTYQRQTILKYIEGEKAKGVTRVCSPLSSKPLSEPIRIIPDEFMKRMVKKYLAESTEDVCPPPPTNRQGKRIKGGDR